MPLTLDSAVASLNQFSVLKAPDIKQKLRQGLEFEKDLTPRACDNTWSAPNITPQDLIQAYQWQFTPNNSDTLSAVDNKLQKIKVDIVITADDLEKFWDSYMVEWHEIGKDPLDWSFPRYLYDEVYDPKILEEMNTNAWKGQYTAPTPGTAGLSINSVDGYEKKMVDAVTAGDLTEYPTGALVEASMVNTVETWIDTLPIPYRDASGLIRMSPTNAKKYYRNYRGEFGSAKGTDNNQNRELRVEMTNKRIVPVNAMEGSNRIIFFPEVTKNMIWGTRRGFPTYLNIRWERQERVIKGLGEIYRFYGFEYWDHLFINDQV